MANKEISDLTDAGTLDGTESLHVVKSGNSRKTTAAKVSRSGLGAVDADIIPDADSTRGLGDATKAWTLAYLDEIRGVGAETLIRRSGGTNATPIVDGVSKSLLFVFGAATPSIAISKNISSITDNGTGDVSASISNAMSTVNYYITSAENSNSRTLISQALHVSASNYRAIVSSETAAFFDSNFSVCVHGDLA